MAYFKIHAYDGNDIYVTVYWNERCEEGNEAEKKSFLNPDELAELFEFINSYQVEGITFEWIY